MTTTFKKPTRSNVIFKKKNITHLAICAENMFATNLGWHFYIYICMFGHVMRREEESMLRVVMTLKMKGKRPQGRPRQRWLDNIDSHLKGKSTSQKEVLRTKCFEYPGRWTAQSAFPPLADLFIPTPTHSSHAAIAQRLVTHIVSTTIYSQVLIYTAEWTEENENAQTSKR